MLRLACVLEFSEATCVSLAHDTPDMTNNLLYQFSVLVRPNMCIVFLGLFPFELESAPTELPSLIIYPVPC